MSSQPPVIDSNMESPDGKLRWAKQHLDAFKDQLTIFEGLNPHTFSIEDDTNTSEYVFKVHGLQPANPDWGFLIGDGIHNLRTALDHLVYQLAILGQGGRPLSDKEARSCSFPIYDDPGKFPDPRKDGPIRLLRRGEQARITELQPFNAWDASIWGTDPLGKPFYRRTHPAQFPALLEKLRDLDNTDKHRTVHPTWRAASWFDAERPPIPLIGSTAYTGSLEDDAEVGRWHYGSPKPPLSAGMDVNRYFPIGVALGQPPFMNSAIEQIDLMTSVVGVVLELFRPCVETGAPALPISTITQGPGH